MNIRYYLPALPATLPSNIKLIITGSTYYASLNAESAFTPRIDFYRDKSNTLFSMRRCSMRLIFITTTTNATQQDHRTQGS